MSIARRGVTRTYPTIYWWHSQPTRRATPVSRDEPASSHTSRPQKTAANQATPTTSNRPFPEVLHRGLTRPVQLPAGRDSQPMKERHQPPSTGCIHYVNDCHSRHGYPPADGRSRAVRADSRDARRGADRSEADWKEHLGGGTRPGQAPLLDARRSRCL